MRGLLIAVCVLAVLAPTTATASPAVQSCAPLGEAGPGITLSGPMTTNTAPFELAGGTYLVRYSFSKGQAMIGNAIVTVKRADGAFYPGQTALTNQMLSQQNPSLSGESFLYGVKPGMHYLDVASAGEWSVTIVPVS